MSIQARRDAARKGTMLEMVIGVTVWVGLGTLAALAVGRASRIGACPTDGPCRRLIEPPGA